ncbi:MAG: DUF433 domain-containing protein [Chloroflexia bacterium]
MLTTEAISQLIHRDPDIMRGTPVFRGTRMPVRSLLDWLEGGHPFDEYLDNFPTVSPEQAKAVLQLANDWLEAQAPLTA